MKAPSSLSDLISHAIEDAKEQVFLVFTVSHELLRVYIVPYKFKYKMGIMFQKSVNRAEVNHKTHLLTLYSWI